MRLAVWGVVSLMEGYGNDKREISGHQTACAAAVLIIGTSSSRCSPAFIFLLLTEGGEILGIILKKSNSNKGPPDRMDRNNLTNMFTDVNDKVGIIASEVGKTPSTWNGSIYTMIRGLSENVIVPIAGIIITFVLCYELISMITEKNNMHDMDTWMFFKWFFKAAVAIYLVTNTFDIVMAVFDIGQNVITGAGGYISGSTSIDIDATLASMQASMEAGASVNCSACR